jgi:MFS family permease
MPMSSSSDARTVSDDAGYPRSTLAWYSVAALMLMYVFSFVDRQIIALLVEPMKRDLGISDLQIGLLQGLAFAVFYTLLGVPIAWLADRYSRRGIIALGMIVWSLMATLCGLARTVTQLFMARIGVGIGEATLSPAAYSIIMDSFPKPRLGRAFAIYNIGIPIGAGSALLVGGLVIGLVSAAGAGVTLPVIGRIHAWQLVFVVTGLPGMLLPLLLFSFREPARHDLMRVKVKTWDALRYFGEHKRLYLPHFLAQALLAMAAYAVSAWLPTALLRAHHVPIAHIGQMLGIATVLMNTTGMLCAGMLCDALARRGVRDAPVRVALFTGLGMAIFTTLPPVLPDLDWVWVAVFVSGLVLNGHAGVGPMAVNQITPNQFRAQISALYLLVVNLIGLGLGPSLVPLLNQALFRDPASIRYSLSIVVLTASLSAVGLLHSVRRAYADKVRADAGQLSVTAL